MIHVHTFFAPGAVMAPLPGVLSVTCEGQVIMLMGHHVVPLDFKDCTAS